MAIFETILFTINMHIGYVLFGAIDVGETLNVKRLLDHTFKCLQEDLSLFTPSEPTLGSWLGSR